MQDYKRHRTLGNGSLCGLSQAEMEAETAPTAEAASLAPDCQACLKCE